MLGKRHRNTLMCMMSHQVLQFLPLAQIQPFIVGLMCSAFLTEVKLQKMPITPSLLQYPMAETPSLKPAANSLFPHCFQGSRCSHLLSLSFIFPSLIIVILWECTCTKYFI